MEARPRDLPTRSSASLVETIEERTTLDPLAERVQAPVSRAMAASPRLRTVVDGTWLGHPLHPALTDVPVGAWTAGLVLDLLELRGRGHGHSRGDAAHVVGLAGALGAAVTGLADWSYTDGRARRVGLVHAAANVAVTALFGASLVARRCGARRAGILLSGAGYGLLLFSSWLGGELAYRHGVGVSTRRSEPPGPANWRPVLDADQLPEGALRRVDLGGTPVLLARRAGEIYAIGDTCTHMGCSLSEGRLERDHVICACHGSHFRLTDGAVLVGPATVPEPCFETRASEGQIEVRLPESRRAA